MKRLGIIFYVFCISFTAFAQEFENIPNLSTPIIVADTAKKSEKRAVLTTFIRPQFKDNWFITLYGGATVMRGEDSPKLDFKDRVKPTIGFSVGKWMSPVWGIRVNITGAKLKGFTHWNDREYGGGSWYVGTNYKDKLNIPDWDIYSSYLDIELIDDPIKKEIAGKFIEYNFLNMDDPQKKGGYSYDVGYIGTSIDFLLNLTNSFSSYDPQRFFDLKMFGGLGYSHTFKRKNATAVNVIMQRYGFQGTFRLTNQFYLDLEPQLLVLPEIFDRRAGDGNTMDGVFNLMVGITYKFKDRNFYEPRAVCNDQALNEEINRLRTLLATPPPPTPIKPVFAYIVPKVEVKKERTEVGTAYLDFEVGKYRILPTFRNNATELENINTTIQTIANDKDIILNEIYLKGYASPEGSYQSNMQLAENRVKALRDYIVNHYNMSSHLFHLDSEPEDWVGFREKVENDVTIPNQDEILSIINSHVDPDQKERNLKVLANGAPYNYVLKNIFPSLRRTEYKVDYTVRGFSLEEAVEVFKTRPQLLSLNELFAVANSYPIGSNEYNTVFETAARIYSNNPIANLNAANVAMSKGDMTSAYKYLNSAGNTPEAIHSQGIYYLLEGDFKNAENYLERAKLSGIKEAEVNLKIARNKLNP